MSPYTQLAIGRSGAIVFVSCFLLYYYFDGDEHMQCSRSPSVSAVDYLAEWIVTNVVLLVQSPIAFMCIGWSLFVTITKVQGTKNA